MDSCTLHWYADRGFELDVDVSNDETTLRMMGVPVPADGTIELAQGVELDRLDILFKSQVDIEGGPGQLHEASVQLQGTDKLVLDAKLEDVETGDIVPLKVTLPVALPDGAPEAGGPKPDPTNEDELDWEDETTLEKMVLQPPEVEAAAAASTGKPPPPASGGFQALLRALVDGPDDDDLTQEEPEPLPEPVKPLPEGLDLASDDEEPASAVDQSMSAEEEAKGLLTLLVNGDHLELEDDHEVDELAPGAAEILALPISGESKAPRLSEWLLEQPAVADLFIGDDDLAEILDQW
jgi:hypothetical protein